MSSFVCLTERNGVQYVFHHQEEVFHAYFCMHQANVSHLLRDGELHLFVEWYSKHAWRLPFRCEAQYAEMVHFFYKDNVLYKLYADARRGVLRYPINYRAKLLFGVDVRGPVHVCVRST